MGDESVTITAYQDGPYLVRGPFRMLDQEGRQITMQRRTVALCRCGKSRLRPLCDGTHRAIGFRASSGTENQSGIENQSPPGQTQPIQAVDLSSSSLAAEDELRRAQRGSTVNANGSRPRPVSRGTLLGLVRDAEQCLYQSLEGPCTATDYAAMSLAEPLLTAARRLLEWGVLNARQTISSGRSNGHGSARLGRPGSTELVARALASAQRLQSPADPRLHQVRSLLTDAKRALVS
ncbi:MAG TPA: CDGSH iron-sulfur domain-containing protein [Solirubrobacteraceae bacterium]|jgi:CDGSH-type Zn-finger protein|nr:CDGSH iron-sulfur domain-containing protein [Solirubrobacteraceae bacterium]